MSTTSRGTNFKRLPTSLFCLLIVINYAKATIDYAALRKDTISQETKRESARTTRTILEELMQRNITSGDNLQHGTEHLLQYGALLRTQILDTFGKLVYDHYDDFGMSQIEALYRVYRETLERKYNIFDIVPSVLKEPDTRPTKICAYINDHVKTCLKESSKTCMNIKIHDEPHEDTLSKPALNVTREIYELADISKYYSRGFSPAAVLEYLRSGRLRFTPALFSGLLHNVQYDSFDDKVRTAERELVLFLTRASAKFTEETEKVSTNARSVSELLKNYLTSGEKIFTGKALRHANYLAEHVIREVDAISENIEWLGTVYDNSTINLKYLFELILSNDTIDKDVLDARNYLLQQIKDNKIVERYLRIEKYQQAGPDQLLMEIFGQLRDIHFAEDLVTSLYTHARFWHKSHMIENLDELLELFDAYENLRDVPEYRELLQNADRIKSDLLHSKNVTIDLLCSRPRNCLRIGLDMVRNCAVIDEKTKIAINAFTNPSCQCSCLEDDSAISTMNTTKLVNSCIPADIKSPDDILETPNNTTTESPTNSTTLTTLNADLGDDDDSKMKHIDSAEMISEPSTVKPCVGDCSSECIGTDCQSQGNCTGSGCTEKPQGKDCKGSQCEVEKTTNKSTTPIECEGPDCEKTRCEGSKCIETSCEEANCTTGPDDVDDSRFRSCEGDDCDVNSADRSGCEGPHCSDFSCEGGDCGGNSTELSDCEGLDCSDVSCEGDDCGHNSIERRDCEGSDCLNSTCEGDDCQDKNIPPSVCEGLDCEDDAKLNGTGSTEKLPCIGANCPPVSCVGNDCKDNATRIHCEGSNCTNSSCEGEDCTEDLDVSSTCEDSDCEQNSQLGGTGSTGSCEGPNCSADKSADHCEGPDCSTEPEDECDDCSKETIEDECQTPDCKDDNITMKPEVIGCQGNNCTDKDCEGSDCPGKSMDGCEGPNCSNTNCTGSNCTDDGVIECEGPLCFNNNCTGPNCTASGTTECKGPDCFNNNCTGPNCAANGTTTECKGPDCFNNNCTGPNCAANGTTTECRGSDCFNNNCTDPDCAANGTTTECRGPDCFNNNCTGPDCAANGTTTECKSPDCFNNNCTGPDCAANGTTTECKSPDCFNNNCTGPNCAANDTTSECKGSDCLNEPTSDCKGSDCPKINCTGPDCLGNGTTCKGPDCRGHAPEAECTSPNCSVGTSNDTCFGPNCPVKLPTQNECTDSDCSSESFENVNCNGPDCSGSDDASEEESDCEGDDCDEISEENLSFSSDSIEDENGDKCEGEECTKEVEKPCEGPDCSAELTPQLEDESTKEPCISDNCTIASHKTEDNCEGANCTDNSNKDELNSIEDEKDCKDGECETNGKKPCEGDECIDEIPGEGDEQITKKPCIGDNCTIINPTIKVNCEGANCTDNSHKDELNSIEDEKDCKDGECETNGKKPCEGDECIDKIPGEGDEQITKKPCIGDNCTIINPTIKDNCEGANCTDNSNKDELNSIEDEKDCKDGECETNGKKPCEGDECIDEIPGEGDEQITKQPCIGDNCTIINPTIKDNCEGANCTDNSNKDELNSIEDEKDCKDGECETNGKKPCEGDECIDKTPGEGDEQITKKPCIGDNCTIINPTIKDNCEGANCTDNSNKDELNSIEDEKDCKDGECETNGKKICEGDTCIDEVPGEGDAQITKKPCIGDNCTIVNPTTEGNCEGANCTDNSGKGELNSVEDEKDCQGGECESNGNKLCEGDECIDEVPGEGEEQIAEESCIGDNCTIVNPTTEGNCEGVNCTENSKKIIENEGDCTGEGCKGIGKNHCKGNECIDELPEGEDETITEEPCSDGNCTSSSVSPNKEIQQTTDPSVESGSTRIPAVPRASTFCGNSDPHYRRQLNRLRKMRRIDASNSTPKYQSWNNVILPHVTEKILENESAKDREKNFRKEVESVNAKKNDSDVLTNEEINSQDIIGKDEIKLKNQRLKAIERADSEKSTLGTSGELELEIGEMKRNDQQRLKLSSTKKGVRKNVTMTDEEGEDNNEGIEKEIKTKSKKVEKSAGKNYRKGFGNGKKNGKEIIRKKWQNLGNKVIKNQRRSAAKSNHDDGYETANNGEISDEEELEEEAHTNSQGLHKRSKTIHRGSSAKSRVKTAKEEEADGKKLKNKTKTKTDKIHIIPIEKRGTSGELELEIGEMKRNDQQRLKLSSTKNGVTKNVTMTDEEGEDNNEGIEKEIKTKSKKVEKSARKNYRKSFGNGKMNGKERKEIIRKKWQNLGNKVIKNQRRSAAKSNHDDDHETANNGEISDEEELEEEAHTNSQGLHKRSKTIHRGSSAKSRVKTAKEEEANGKKLKNKTKTKTDKIHIIPIEKPAGKKIRKNGSAHHGRKETEEEIQDDSKNLQNRWKILNGGNNRNSSVKNTMDEGAEEKKNVNIKTKSKLQKRWKEIPRKNSTKVKHLLEENGSHSHEDEGPEEIVSHRGVLKSRSKRTRSSRKRPTEWLEKRRVRTKLRSRGGHAWVEKSSRMKVLGTHRAKPTDRRASRKRELLKPVIKLRNDKEAIGASERLPLIYQADTRNTEPWILKRKFTSKRPKNVPPQITKTHQPREVDAELKRSAPVTS